MVTHYGITGTDIGSAIRAAGRALIHQGAAIS
jgi:hypothetical protein